MYGVIYADPPWSFRVWNKATGSGRSAESHYPTMPNENIYSIPVHALANRDCALFLWVTMPTLKEGFRTIERWGFTYKTVAFTWVKGNLQQPTPFVGMGYWTRANPELCLLATRGSVKRQSKSVRQLVLERRGKHSEKPDEVRKRIEQLVPGPYVELFCRNPRIGWDSMGNELNGKHITEAIRERVGNPIPRLVNRKQREYAAYELSLAESSYTSAKKLRGVVQNDYINILLERIAHMRSLIEEYDAYWENGHVYHF